jgi:hypothetical protein
MDVDLNRLKGTYLRGPKLADVPYPVKMEPNLVVEYYSLWSVVPAEPIQKAALGAAFFVGYVAAVRR